MKVIVKGKECELEDIIITGNSSEESEININYVAAEDRVTYYTSSNKYLTKLKKVIAVNPDAWEVGNVVLRTDGTISGVVIYGPVNSLSIRSGKKTEVSPERREAAAERFKTTRQKLNQN